MIVEEDFKRWTAKRKAALVTEILQGKTEVDQFFETGSWER